MSIILNTRHLGRVEVDFDELTPAVQQYVVAYGLKQSIDDAGASPEKAAAGSQARLDNLLNGMVPAGGGGGTRISPVERELREMVKGLLVQCGYKAAAATKLAKAPKYGLLQILEDRGVEADNLPEVLERNWETLVSKAKAAVSEREFDIDLG